MQLVRLFADCLDDSRGRNNLLTATSNGTKIGLGSVEAGAPSGPQDEKEEIDVSFGVSKVVLGIIAIIAGVLILVFPGLLRWIVGVFLIVWGILTVAGKRD